MYDMSSKGLPVFHTCLQTVGLSTQRALVPLKPTSPIVQLVFDPGDALTQKHVIIRFHFHQTIR